MSKNVPQPLVDWFNTHIKDAETFYKDSVKITSDDAREYYTRRPITVTCQTESDGMRRVHVGGVETLISFAFGGYPSCCAMCQFHTFSYSHRLSESLVHSFLDALFNTADEDSGQLPYKNTRLVVAMVESKSTITRPVSSEAVRRIMGEPLPELVGEPSAVFFPFFKTWFEKQHKCRTMDRFWNKNTGNTINFLEVVI